MTTEPSEASEAILQKDLSLKPDDLFQTEKPDDQLFVISYDVYYKQEMSPHKMNFVCRADDMSQARGIAEMQKTIVNGDSYLSDIPLSVDDPVVYHLEDYSVLKVDEVRSRYIELVKKVDKLENGEKYGETQ